jgi:hypothetical protein
MNTPTTIKTIIQQALEAIFDSKANAMPPTTKFDTDTVRIVRTVIAPDQLQALAAFSGYIGQFPTITRSGAHTTVVFAC